MAFDLPTEAIPPHSRPRIACLKAFSTFSLTKCWSIPTVTDLLSALSTFQRLTRWRCRFKGHGIHCLIVNTCLSAATTSRLYTLLAVTLACINTINLQDSMCVRVFCASSQPLCIIGHSADSDCKALRHKTEDNRTIFIMHLGALQGRARDALCFLASNGEGGLGGGRGFGKGVWEGGGYRV